MRPLHNVLRSLQFDLYENRYDIIKLKISTSVCLSVLPCIASPNPLNGLQRNLTLGDLFIQ